MYNQDTVQKNEPNKVHKPEEYGQRVLGSGDEGSALRCQKRQNSEWSSQKQRTEVKAKTEKLEIEDKGLEKRKVFQMGVMQFQT